MSFKFFFLVFTIIDPFKNYFFVNFIELIGTHLINFSCFPFKLVFYDIK